MGKFNPQCLCIFPSYDIYIILNMILTFSFLMNIMFEPFERNRFRNRFVDTKSFNIYNFMVMLTINLYFFIFHIFFEKLAYFLGYL